MIDNIFTYILWVAIILTVGVITIALGIEWQIGQDLQDLRDAGYTVQR